jgi:hypothetical protein
MTFPLCPFDPFKCWLSHPGADSTKTWQHVKTLGLKILGHKMSTEINNSKDFFEGYSGSFAARLFLIGKVVN